MALTPGTRLGVYQITAPHGERRSWSDVGLQLW